MPNQINLATSIIIALSLAACATTSDTARQSMVPDALNDELDSQFGLLKEKHEAFMKKSKKAGRLRLLGGTLTTGTAIASAAITAFDGGMTALAATSLSTTATGQITGTFAPQDRVRFYRQAANSMVCMGNRTNELSDQRAATRTPITYVELVERMFDAPAATPDPLLSRNFQDLDEILLMLISIGQAVNGDSPELVAAITSAQSARQSLGMGLQAQATAEGTLNSAIQTVSDAVEELQQPNLESLVMAISQSVMSSAMATTPTPSGGNEGETALRNVAAQQVTADRDGGPAMTFSALAEADQEKAITRFSELQSDLPSRVTLYLNLMTARVQALRPQTDAEIVARISGCVAGFSQSQPR